MHKEQDNNENMSVDFILKWKEAQKQEPETSRGDRLDLSGIDASGVLEESLTEFAGDSRQILIEGELPSSSEVSGEESFQWSHEKARQIDEALSGPVTNRFPAVHEQLDLIRVGLETRNLESESGSILLDQVNSYLSKKISRWKSKTPIAHEDVISSRSLTLDALYLYLEVSGLLNEYIETGNPVKLTLACQLLGQGSSFMDMARSTLSGAQPPAPGGDQEIGEQDKKAEPLNNSK